MITLAKFDAPLEVGEVILKSYASGALVQEFVNHRDDYCVMIGLVKTQESV